jgi:Stf0 sulphotransferase
VRDPKKCQTTDPRPPLPSASRNPNGIRFAGVPGVPVADVLLVAARAAAKGSSRGRRLQGEGTSSYFICASPKTGSTLLCGLPADTGRAGKPESYFRLKGEPSYAESWPVPMGPPLPRELLGVPPKRQCGGSGPRNLRGYTGKVGTE